MQMSTEFAYHIFLLSMQNKTLRSSQAMFYLGRLQKTMQLNANHHRLCVREVFARKLYGMCLHMSLLSGWVSVSVHVPCSYWHVFRIQESKQVGQTLAMRRDDLQSLMYAASDFACFLTTFVNVIKCNWLRLCALPLLRCTLDLIYLLWVSGRACLSLKVDGVINCSRTPIILINQSAVDSYLHSFCVYTCPCIYISHNKDIIHWNMDRLFLQFMLKASS